MNQDLTFQVERWDDALNEFTAASVATDVLKDFPEIPELLTNGFRFLILS